MNITELIKTGECHITTGHLGSTRLLYDPDIQKFEVYHNEYRHTSYRACQTADEAEAVEAFITESGIIDVTSHPQPQSR